MGKKKGKKGKKKGKKGKKKGKKGKFCKGSPKQKCRMKCKKPKCKKGQCIMRKGSCCRMKCKKIKGGGKKGKKGKEGKKGKRGKFCKGSPRQRCRKKCQMPRCRGGQCIMRKGSC